MKPPASTPAQPRDRNFLMPNRCIGTCSWCIAPATACTVHTTACSVYAIACTVHATSCSVHAIACTPPAIALAVGPFVGQGCERSELPCLGHGDKKLGRRPWSFLRLWCLLSGIMGEPSALPMDFEACKGTSNKGEYDGHAH